MTIFYMDQINLSTANNLSAGSVPRETVAEYSAEAVLQEWREITLIASSDAEATTLGGKAPQQIADDFAVMFNGHDKAELQHVYLIASEAGFNKLNQPTLAQQLVVALRAKGFNNVVAHAIAAPTGLPVIGLRVAVEDNGTFKALMLSTGDVDLAPSEATQLVSVANYKAAMQERFNTFTHDGPTGIQTADMLMAIKYLQDKKQELVKPKPASESKEIPLTKKEAEKRDAKLKKQQGYLSLNISQLKQANNLGTDAVIRLLQGDRTAREMSKSQYYQEIIVPLNKLLQQAAIVRAAATQQAAVREQSVGSSSTSSSSVDTNASPVSLASSSALPSYVFASFPASPVHERDDYAEIDTDGEYSRYDYDTDGEDDNHVAPAEQDEDLEPADYSQLLAALESYRNKRQNEWQFHYNFLGLMSVLYYIEDCILGTDHFNSKSKDVKLSAADKLVNILNEEDGEELTKAERLALSEGRLGEAVAKSGGLDSILLGFRLSESTSSAMGMR